MDAIVAHCRRQLASYKPPRQIRIIETLPRNSNGKILKGTLLALFNNPA